MRKIFVTGIGTDVGKTFISAILTEALQADYWKPVQSGSFLGSDKERVKNLVSNSTSRFHDETYLFEKNVSPHAAAEAEQVTIDINKITLPVTQNNLIIEGAGGLLVPLNDQVFIADLITKFDSEVVVVSVNYLGSINHTLLTLEALKARKLKLTALIFNGSRNPATENIIIQHAADTPIFFVNRETSITPETIVKYAPLFKSI